MLMKSSGMARSEIDFLINKSIEAARRHYTLARLDRCHFRSTPINGHHQTGPVGPVR
jgi:hypothetical protein